MLRVPDGLCIILGQHFEDFYQRTLQIDFAGEIDPS